MCSHSSCGGVFGSAEPCEDMWDMAFPALFLLQLWGSKGLQKWLFKRVLHKALSKRLCLCSSRICGAAA